jgi:citronellyl-CoA dehydrogenase
MLFTQEHEDFRASVRQLVLTEIEPYVDEWERAGIYPAHELFPKIAALGIFGLEYDPAFGGEGADHAFAVVAAEELGRSLAAGVSMGVSVQGTMATPSLNEFGTDELKRQYLTPALKGEQVCSIAVTEPGAGSDVAGIRTHAVRDGGDWVINGTKIYITNGTQADWICLLARTSDEPGYRGMSQIIVETKTPGFSVSRSLRKLGNWSSDTAELVLQDVRVPRSNTIGEENRGFQQQMKQFVVERMFGCHVKTEAMQDALDRTCTYLHDREVFGKPLAANEHVAYRMAEVGAKVDMARVYNHAMAERHMAGEDVTRQATVAKLMVGRLCREVADTCIQYYGGQGYMDENWTSRYFRDQRLMSIGGGADEVMLNVLARMDGLLGGARKPAAAVGA